MKTLNSFTSETIYRNFSEHFTLVLTNQDFYVPLKGTKRRNTFT